MKIPAGNKPFSCPLGMLAQINCRAPGFLATAVLVAWSTVCIAQAGHLDTTFGTGGVFTTNFTQTDATMAIAVAIQSDGKIVIGGSTPGGAALARLNTNGTLDSSFGSGGIVNNTFAVDGPVVALAIQSDGKIVALAEGFLGGSVGRFNSDGSVDTTFGTGGFAVSKSLNSGPGTLNALVLQADGKILVTGGGLIGRYTTEGQLDATFGSSGIAALSSTIVTGMAAQSDGKILVTTGSGAPTELFSSPNAPGTQPGAITRYNSDGSLDKSFGVSGQSACVAAAAAIAIQSNGKIVVAGGIPAALKTLLESDGVTVANNQTGFGVVRYNSNGSLDTTFNPGSGVGTGGGVITGFGNSFPAGGAFALAIQSNGDIVVAGEAGVSINAGQTLISSSFVLARYTSSGHLDTSFGTNGTVITTLRPGPISFISAIALQSDGKIVAAGNGGFSAGGFVDNFAIARYLAQ